MWKNLFWCGVAVAAQAQSATQPVPVDNVQVARESFNADQPVVVMISAELPNPCFNPQAASVEREKPDVIRISLNATMRTDGACEDGSAEDAPVSYRKRVNLGVLPSGAYRIAFEAQDETRTPVDKEVSFRVE